MSMYNQRKREIRRGEALPGASAERKSEAEKRRIAERILRIGGECACLPVFDEQKPEDQSS